MKNIKKIFILFIILLIVAINCSTFVFANETNKYVALGDSIAYGYGLSDISKQSYVSQVANKLEITPNNKAVVGMDTTEFLNLINQEEIESEIKSANIITISIGSNDLLGIVVKLIGNAFGVDVNNESDMLENVQNAFNNATVTEKIQMIGTLYTSLNSDATKQNLSLAVKKYGENWENIITKIKELNPNATIIATQFYNPYYGVDFPLMEEDINFSDYVDSYIKQFNVILENKKSLGYDIAYIYDYFNKTGVTNVNISIDEFNVDPHPNSVGHTIIANEILKVYGEINNAEIEKTDINKCTISKVSNQIYTGQEIKPQIIVKDGTTTLKENEDYTLNYSNNKEIGTATIIIAGMGNYTGTKSIEFKIIDNKEKDKNNTLQNIYESNNKEQGNVLNKDSTTANQILPYAGSLKVLLILMIISGIGITFKYKSNKINI